MSIETDYATLRSVLAAYEPSGWAVEFGVYSGYSLGIIAEHMPVIGFDSFEGLPEDWREGFPKGTFLDIDWTTIFGPNQMIVPGWFADTTDGFPFPPLGLVHIDCDLYSSTITALEAVTHAVRPGTVLVFDEFHSYPGCEQHEQKAFIEWVRGHNVTVDAIGTGTGKDAQEQAFVILSMDHDS